MQELDLIQKIAIWLLPVLFAITLHEAAHGFVAMLLGDRTAQMLGRVTLNPLRHIDPFGTVLLPALLYFTGGMLFGWAKPVPVTYENLKQPKRDMALVALAGPASNLLQGLFWALVVQLALIIGTGLSFVSLFLLYVGVAGVFINTVLMLLNLMPIPPLDGGRVLTGVLPGPLSYKFSRLEPYGLVILVVLLVSGLLGQVLWPLVTLTLHGLSLLSGLSYNQFMLVMSNLLG